jgi:hypothetical protein
MQNNLDDSLLKELTDLKTGLENNLDIKLNAIQNHVDKLDVKLQENRNGLEFGTKTLSLKDALKNTLNSKENEVKSLTNDKLLVKSVFTSNVTGGNNHTFRDTVVLKPAQLVNVTDLIGGVQIQGGAYSYAVETVTGAPAVQTEGEPKADVSISFEYETVQTDFIAGITEVSRQFLNNYTSLANSIPTILQREFYKAENTLYSVEMFAKATASSVTGTSEVEVLTKEVSAMLGDNIQPTAIVLNPADYTNILLNETNATSGYDLPPAMNVSSTGQVTVLGVPVYMATWIDAGNYIVFNGNKVLDCIQEGLNLQIDNSEKFSSNISIFRIEKQSQIAILAPAEVVKGTFSSPSV